MISYLKKIKRTKFWYNIIDYIIYPIYHFIWCYIINLKAKVLYFFWSLKKKSFFPLNNNDKLLVGTTNEFKSISRKILEEMKPLMEDFKKVIYSKEYSEELKKTNYASGEIPFRIDIYEKLSSSLQKEIVEFASSDKMITTASNYLKVFPILARIELYLNIPREKSELRGAMKWHKDNFGFKNLDFMMPVTGIDESNGSFYCLEKKIYAGVFKSFDFHFQKTGERNKISLEIFDQKFKNEKIIELKGESGTGIFLDTFSNYHRGGFCKENDRIMLRFCYQTHDAICHTFDFNEDFYPYDKSITKENTNNIFKKFLYFKRPPFFLKIIKNKLLKFYYLIECKY